MGSLVEGWSLPLNKHLYQGILRDIPTLVLGRSKRMRMSYDPDADAFYLSLAEIPYGAVHRSEEVAH